MVAVFLVHILTNIRIAVASRRTGNHYLLDIVLIVLGIIALGITIIMERA
jgi:hypothetical protein